MSPVNENNLISHQDCSVPSGCESFGSASLPQQRPHSLPDQRAHRFDALGRVDDPHPLRLGGRDGGETLVHSLEKGAVGFLHAVAQWFVERELHAVLLGGAPRHFQEPILPREPARFADLERDVEQEREVWAGAFDGKFYDRLDLREIELASVALVSRGRIVEAVAKDDLPGGQRGADDFADELSAAGVEKEQLGLGGHRVVGLAVLERVSDFLADGRAARLSQDARSTAQFAQPRAEQPDLRRFPASFGPLEGDEQAFHGRHSSRKPAGAPVYLSRSGVSSERRIS